MRNKLIISCLCLAGIASLNAQEAAPITATEYKQRVLEYSQQIKQSAEQRVAMQEAMKAAKTAFFPVVDASGNYQYRINNYDMGIAGVPLSMRHETYSVEAGVSQSIYAGGSIYNNYKASQVQTQIAEKAEELTVDNVIYSADMSYWGAAAQKEIYETMCQYVDIIQTLANVLTERFDDGLISKTDLLQVQARLKDAELQKVSAYKNYQIALQNLNVLMGNNPMEPVLVTDSLSMYQMMPLQIGADVALDNRPEYQISQLNLDYQKRQINLAKSKYNPSLAIGLKENWGTQMLNMDGKTLFNSIVYASVNIPIFHWGARFKAVNAQKALLRSKEYEMQATRDQITQEVSKAWTNLTENTKQIVIAEANCKISEESLDLNTFSYNEGKLPILDVLSAQLSWIQSYNNLIQSWYQQKVSLADYNKAVGLRRLQ